MRESVLLRFVRVHADDLPAFKLALTQQLIFSKSSAALEGDSKTMHDFSEHAGPALPDGSLSKRLRLKVNTPSVLEDHARSKSFIELVAANMASARPPSTRGRSSTRTPQKRKASLADGSTTTKRKHRTKQLASMQPERGQKLREQLVGLGSEVLAKILETIFGHVSESGLPSASLLEAPPAEFYTPRQ